MTAPAATLCRACAAGLAEVAAGRRKSFTFCDACQPGIDAALSSEDKESIPERLTPT